MLSLPSQSFVMNLSYLLEQDVYQREWGRGFKVKLIFTLKEHLDVDGSF